MSHIDCALGIAFEQWIVELDDVRLSLDEHLIQILQKRRVGRIVRPQRKYPVGVKLGGGPFDLPLGVPD